MKTKRRSTCKWWIDNAASEAHRVPSQLGNRLDLDRVCQQRSAIYRFYSQLDFDSSPDNTNALNRMQFWRFLKDCKIHLSEVHLTLMHFDRLLSASPNNNQSSFYFILYFLLLLLLLLLLLSSKNRSKHERKLVLQLYRPHRLSHVQRRRVQVRSPIVTREFVYVKIFCTWGYFARLFLSCSGEGLKIAWCTEKLIVEKILPFSCSFQSFFYTNAEKTLSVITYMVEAYECRKRNVRLLLISWLYIDDFIA